MESNPESPLLNPKEDSKSPRLSKKSRKMSFDIDGDQCDNDEFSSESASNQMVVFKSETGDKGQDEQGENHSSYLQNLVPSNPSNRGLPSIGAFTVQCATCFKWRLIPTKEKYEEIRERILQEPFVCERAREWRPDIACDDPEDISQDGSRLWAIDKPNIAQPPPGWERLIRIRGEGGTRFADVYYTSPTGKKLRSMVEIERYLSENPDCVAQGVSLAQFSFQIPRPLQQNYVKKRAPRLMGPCDSGGPGLPKHLAPEEVLPLSWAAPPSRDKLEVSEHVSHTEDPLEPIQVEPLRKRKAGSPQSGEAYPSPVRDQPNIKLEDAETRDASTCEL